MTHSQNKGKNGEREAAKYLNSLGFNAVRACQLGVTDGRDVIVKDLPNVYLEVKRVEGLDLGTKQLQDAYTQARDKCPDAGASEAWPCGVLWRPNGSRAWRFTFYDDKCGLVTVFRDCDIKANLVMLNGGGK